MVSVARCTRRAARLQPTQKHTRTRANRTRSAHKGIELGRRPLSYDPLTLHCAHASIVACQQRRPLFSPSPRLTGSLEKADGGRADGTAPRSSLSRAFGLQICDVIYSREGPNLWRRRRRRPLATYWTDSGPCQTGDEHDRQRTEAARLQWETSSSLEAPIGSAQRWAR